MTCARGRARTSHDEVDFWLRMVVSPLLDVRARRRAHVKHKWHDRMSFASRMALRSSDDLSTDSYSYVNT